MKATSFIFLLCWSAVAVAQVPPRTPLLLPVLGHDVPGAFGSVWRSDFTAFAERDVLLIYNNACPFECTNNVIVPGGAGAELTNAIPLAPGGPGPLVYTAAGDPITFSLRVRDVTRQADSWGTQIPIVRETDLFSSAFDIINVPTAERFRQMLRLYDVSGDNGAVHVEYFTLHSNRLVKTIDVALSGTADQYVVGPVYPAYAQVYEGVPAGTVDDDPALRIRVTPTTATQKLWAMVTVTNNVTQEFTVISPLKP